MSKQNSFNEQIADRARRAAIMRNALVEPFRTENGFLTPSTQSESEKRDMILEGAIKGTFYEGSKNGAMIAAIHARALQGYEMQYGHLPSDDMLAACHKACENAMLIGTGKVALGGIFEGADMSTTEGILMRDRLVSLVLPVWLQTITANMVTFMPGDFNQSEFIRVKRIAGSTFGDLKKGDVIDFNYGGVYSAMDRREELGTGDDSTTSYTFTSSDKYGVPYPMKNNRVRVYVDRKSVAEDNGSGALAGTYTPDGGSPVVVSGTVDYEAGVVSVSFSAAPAAGVELHIGFDVNIEKDPTLIPRVDHQMESRVLYPHESAIAGSSTIQALWALRRELGQDIDNLTMQALRNLLAADKDRKHLHDMEFHAKSEVEWTYTAPDGLTLKEHYESLQAAFLEVDSIIMNGTGVTGLVGIVAGTNACNIMRYLPDPYFKPAPGYRSVAQPHYVGKVFGMWDLYCNPQATDPNSCLCYGKGPDHGQTAYVAGDAVPALTFKHSILGDLVSRATMWDLAYRDMQPFDGEKYLCKLTMVPADGE